MERFKYYKRGEGELDTSNFPQIAEHKTIFVNRLDSKTFVSLLALNEYLRSSGTMIGVIVLGYVDHLRGDKDVYPPANLYGLLDNMVISCQQIQHESTDKIESAQITSAEIAGDLKIMNHKWFTTFIGADSSVSKFFPGVDLQAEKVRENGKVLANVLKGKIPEAAKRIIIVDDLLGGGATVRMLVDHIREKGFEGEILLWVQYNEGIHSDDFLGLFDNYYIGDTI